MKLKIKRMEKYIFLIYMTGWQKTTVYIHTTRIQLILPVDWSEDARRGSQVYTKWTVTLIAFRTCRTCYRQKLTVWQGKSILCQKTRQKRLFLCARIGVTWLCKDLDAKRLTPGQLLGCTWKLWGMTLPTSFVEGRWHQNWANTSPLYFFTVGTCKFAEKWFFG